MYRVRSVQVDEDPEESLDELGVLAESAGATVVARILQGRQQFDVSTLIGSGKLLELKAQVESLDADLVLFDQELSGVQLRNLERELPCRVVDRTQLILDIFARRARTREGYLQVELAQLNYLLPRLTGRGAAMSRLGGGIGTRGPGETQLETDRRRIRQRIKKLDQDLESVRGARGTQRRKRMSVPLQTIALVGYTNAGKSTLFNRLTQAGVLADAKMFATLDPTIRQVVLPSRHKALLSDTVGFIRQLPTTLVEAFRATLEEVAEAALLLHVVDSSSPVAPHHCAHVRKVLNEIGADKAPQLLVLNKMDVLNGEAHDPVALRARLQAEAGTTHSVSISARTGEGLPALLDALDALLPKDTLTLTRFVFPVTQLSKLHRLHSLAVVEESKYECDVYEVHARVPERLRRELAEFVVPND